jgi:ketosteroid isomerase-like protein
MSQENVEIVRTWLALFVEVDEGLADPERLTEFITKDGSFTFSGFLEDHTTFHSMDEFLKFRAAWMEPYDDWSYEPEKFLDAGENRVLILFHQRGKLRDSDSWVELHYGIVYTVEEGLLSGAVIYADPAKALEAAGLSE